MAHKSDSLFDAEAVENKGQRKNYNTSWDLHLNTTTEAAMLERTPAFATDYVYQLELPDDTSSERLSEFGSDLEYSNFHERSLLRVVVGPLKLSLPSGLFHRIGSLRTAASAYDYSPYSTPKPDSPRSELPPPIAEDFDALNENIPSRTVQITVIAPVVELQPLDHPHFAPTKGNLFRTSKHKASPPQLIRDALPRLTFECQCVDVRIQNPMYLKRLINTACQLPDCPKHMFEACHSRRRIKISGFCSRFLAATSKRQTTILTPTSATLQYDYILKPQYWIDPDTPHEMLTFESGNSPAPCSQNHFTAISNCCYRWHYNYRHKTKTNGGGENFRRNSQKEVAQFCQLDSFAGRFAQYWYFILLIW